MFQVKISTPLVVARSLGEEDVIRHRGVRMDVTVWRNGRRDRAGIVYGVRVSRTDRDRFFDTCTPEVSIEVEGKLACKTLSSSFWSGCSEIRHPAIAEFIVRRGLAEWPARKPHLLSLEPVKKNRFRLSVKGEESNVLSGLRY